MTWRQLITEGSRELQGRSSTPELDSRLLLGHLMTWNRHTLYLNWSQEIPAESQALLKEYSDGIKRRKTGYPMAYLTHKKEFMGKDFYVDEGVLIPRPDTEILVEEALRLIDLHPTPSPRILDLCAGSGCIGISVTLATGYPVHLADLSPKALEVAQFNSETHLGKALPLIQTDLFSNLEGTWDFILTNPPYLTPGQTEVCLNQGWCEPAMALDGGGTQGLDLIEKLITQGAPRLALQGWLLIEAAPDQDTRIQDLLSSSGLKVLPPLPDLSGRQRVWRAQKWTNSNLSDILNI